MPTKLLVSEGDGDEAFLKKLIAARKLRDFRIFHRQGSGMAGKDAFQKMLTAILTDSEFDDCSLIVVVADNDSSPTASFKSIVRQIKNARGYAIPARPREIAVGEGVRPISVLMLPWDGVAGDVETVCFDLASMMRPQIAECVNAFIKCARAEEWPISQLSKLQLRCLMAASCKKDPNTGLPHAWSGRRRPKNLIPLYRNGKYLEKIVSYLRQL